MRKLFFISLFLISAVVSYSAQLGPWAINDNTVSQPVGYSKIIVHSTPFSAGGTATFENVETGEHVTFDNNVVYFDLWYCYIPSGTYRLISIETGYKVFYGASLIGIGDCFVVSESGAITFEPC